MQVSKSQTLNELLSIEGKHSKYQSIASEVTSSDQGTSCLRQNIYNDPERYEWLKSSLTKFDGKVLDIGANLGYFSFRLLEDYNAQIVAYEPFAPHVQAMTWLRNELGRTEEEFKIISQGVDLKQVERLKSADLLIFLNVLHHAGDDFDCPLVNNSTEWRDYAIRYLKGLRNKTGMMFFQLGYTWKGWAEPLCKHDQIIDFTGDLLAKSGWTVRRVGLIERYRVPVSYAEYPYRRNEENPVVLQRSGVSLYERVVDRLLKGRIVPLTPYRFAQRPLWLCE